MKEKLYSWVQYKKPGKYCVIVSAKLIAEREADNRVGTTGTSGVLVWGCACMCLQLKYTSYGFMFSLRTFLARAAHDAIVMEVSEDRKRRQVREQVQRYRKPSTG